MEFMSYEKFGKFLFMQPPTLEKLYRKENFKI